MKGQEVREKFIELRSRGHSYRKISEELDVSKTTLISWGKRYAEQIDLLGDEELESLCERLRIARASRIERFVQIIDRVEEEVAGRELGDVTTYGLLRLWARLMEGVRLEVDPERLEVAGGISVANPLDRWEAIIREVIDKEAVLSHLASE